MVLSQILNWPWIQFSYERRERGREGGREGEREEGEGGSVREGGREGREGREKEREEGEVGEVKGEEEGGGNRHSPPFPHHSYCDNLHTNYLPTFTSSLFGRRGQRWLEPQWVAVDQVLLLGNHVVQTLEVHDPLGAMGVHISMPGGGGGRIRWGGGKTNRPDSLLLVVVLLGEVVLQFLGSEKQLSTHAK